MRRIKGQSNAEPRIDRHRFLWTVRFGALGVVAALVISACGGGGEAPTATQPTATNPVPQATPTRAVTLPAPTQAPAATATATPAPAGQQSVAVTYRERYSSDRLADLSKGPPVYGGTFVGKAVGGLPASWDVTGIGANFSFIIRQFMNGLVDVKQGDDANGRVAELEGDLAERWDVSQDGKTFTFRLRQGVKWWNRPPANGRELTSDDVKFALDTFKTKTALLIPLLSVVDTIDAPDRYTVRLTTKDPAPDLLLGLAQPPVAIFAKEAFDDKASFSKGLTASTGPFIPDELVEQVKITMNKNPNYFKNDATGRQLPYLDRVERLFFADPGTELAAFRTGKVHEYVPFGVRELEDIRKSNPNTVFAIVPPGPTGPYAFYPRLDKAPWNDVRVRRAVSLAINRQAIIDTAYDGLAAYGAPMSWTFFGKEYPFDPGELGPYVKFDPDQAKRLLVEAGFSGGLKTNIITTETSGAFFNALLQAQADLKKVGVDLEIRTLDGAAKSAQFFTGKFEELSDTRYLTSGIDPDDYTYAQLFSKSPANVAHVNDPVMDDLVLKQRTIFDQGERQKVLRQIFDRELDQVYHLWVANPYKILARQPFVHNVADNVFYWAFAFGNRVTERVWLSKQ